MKSAARQLTLFSLSGSFTVRLGAEFFANLPETPGVYFFYGAEDQLLYIGQSHNLRKRIGSYRFVTSERQSKRIARLAHRIARVEYELCQTAEDAIRLESELLLKHRPPFNRAGVWVPPPVWLRMNSCSGKFHVELVSNLPGEEITIGPLPSSFRHVFAMAMRCIFRILHPATQLWEFPMGMMGANVRKLISFRTTHSAEMEQLLLSYLAGNSALMDQLQASFPEPEIPSELDQFWLDQLDALMKWQRKHTGQFELRAHSSVNADAAAANSPWTNTFDFS